jgi:hypothetical protein
LIRLLRPVTVFSPPAFRPLRFKIAQPFLTCVTRGLAEADPDRRGSVPAFGGEVTVAEFIDSVVFQSAAQHLDSIKKAIGG